MEFLQLVWGNYMNIGVILLFVIFGLMSIDGYRPAGVGAFIGSIFFVLLWPLGLVVIGLILVAAIMKDKHDDYDEDDYSGNYYDKDY